MVDGLDWSYAALHLPEASIIEETVRDFHKLIGRQADKLRAAYDSRDWEAYRIQVHGMKSSAATIGIVPLAGMARVLEQAAAAGDAGTITAMHEIFMVQWMSYKDRLTGVCGITSDAEAAAEDERQEADPSVYRAMLELLRTHMDELDVDAADGVMSQIRGYRAPEGTGELVEELGVMVADLDSDGAAGLIDRIIERMDK